MTQTVNRDAVDADGGVGLATLLAHPEARPEAERDRCPSAVVVDAIREAGLYTMARPKAYGGLTLDRVSSFRVVEESPGTRPSTE